MKKWRIEKMSTCRFCGSSLKDTFADLGAAPLANSYLKQENLIEAETFYPLCASVCSNCFLVQLPEVAAPDTIFSDYAYFSSYSDYWLAHAKAYTEMMLDRFNLGVDDFVVEIASNDGYLLQYFREKGIPILGIEPAVNVANVAISAGIPTVTRFFGVSTAKELVMEKGPADLLIANNVLAHVPNINDFVEGMKMILAPDGIITVEFPHLVNLMKEKQFDTIYHEHFSYLSFSSVDRIFSAHDLRLFDVEKLETHGGSLRIYGCHKEDQTKPSSERTSVLLQDEKAFGLSNIETYKSFEDTIIKIRCNVLDFLIGSKKLGLKVVGYGAPAKGNTLLNYCGIRTDFIEYTVDRSPHKQGCYLPGSRIPIYHPDKINETKPDYVVILPWNIKEEIMAQMSHIREWGGKFVVFIPEIRIYE
jgi:SAM-dependent methyltransferase